MKKKVVIITEASGGGVRKHIIDLLNNLSTDKYDLYFLYSLNRADQAMKEELKKIDKSNVSLIELKYMKRDINMNNDFNAFKEIKKHLKKIEPDIVHCHSSKAGAIGRLVSKLIGVNQIYYTPHAYIMQNLEISNIKKIAYMQIEMFLSKLCTTRNINVSYGEREFAVKKKIDKCEKFKVIYNGIDENIDVCDNLSIKKEFRIGKDDLVVGVTARMDEQKDPFTFIKIAHEVVKINKNIKFIYIGDGVYKEDIEKYIKDNNICENVKLLGFRSDIERLLQVFDIYLITSLYEGMPYSLIEALKYKLPIIATDTIGNNEIVDNGINGYLFEVRNYEEGVNKLLCLANNKSLIKSMGDNSYKLFKQKFTLDKMILNTENLYDCTDE